MSSWTIGNFCKNCHKEIKYSTKMYAQGVCPYCMNSSGGTIVDCYIRLYKDFKVSPWWKFWKVETHRVFYKKRDPEGDNN